MKATSSVTLLAALGVVSLSTQGADIINGTSDEIKYSFEEGVSEVRNSTLSNSNDQVLFVTGSATLNITGGNAISVHATSDSDVVAVLANGSSTVNISGENTFTSDGQRGCLLGQNSSGSLNIDGNNTFKSTGDKSYGIFQDGAGEVTISGINTFEITDGKAIRQYGSQGKLTVKSGAQLYIRNGDEGLDIRNVIIEEGATVDITGTKTGLTLRTNGVTVKGFLNVETTETAFVFKEGGNVLTVDGGIVTINAADGGTAIQANQQYSDSQVTVSNSGQLSVTGDVSKYEGSYSVSGNSTAQFSDLVVNNSLSVSDSTLNVAGIQNNGTATFTNAVVNADLVEGSTGSFGATSASATTFNLGKGNFTFEHLNGQGNTMVLSDATPNKVVISSASEGSTLTVTGTQSGENYASPEQYAQALASAVVQNTDSGLSAATTVLTPANDIYAATESSVVNGVLQFNAESLAPSQALQGLQSLAALSAVNWRHEMNSVSKRMGELRDLPSGVGLWVRAYGSEMQYGAQNLNVRNKTIQVGSDASLGDWKLGVAFNYTDGSSTYSRGDADLESWGAALYGTWLVPCGAYVDLIAKYMKMDSDFTLNGMGGSMDNDALSASVEVGYRFSFVQDMAFIEPQAGLSYGKVKGDTFNATNGVRVVQDDYESLLGRVGFRAGLRFPENKGAIFARVSGVYDFDGEMSALAVKGASSIKLDDDIGGAYVEYGVGANFNLTENAYVHVDLERTNGGEVKENWRWNAGLRYVW